MTRGFSRVLGAFGFVACTFASRFAHCQVQTMSTTVVDAGTYRPDEPAITCSRLNSNEVLVGWQRLFGSDPTGTAFWSLSIDGVTFTQAAPFQPQQDPCTSSTLTTTGDVMVARSLSGGDLWIGTLETDGNNAVPTMAVARHPAGNRTIGSYTTVHACPEADKCFMAAGPFPAGMDSPPAQEVLYVGYKGSGYAWTNSSGRQYPSGYQWNTSPQAVLLTPAMHSQGLGAFPVVLPSGRLVLTYTSATGGSQYTTLPSVTYNDHGGSPLMWASDQPLMSYGPGPTNIYPVGYLGYAPIAGGILPSALPSMDFDPTNPSTVLVVFAGRTDSNLNPPSGNTLDLFVARGTQSPSGAEVFSPADTYRIDDAVLRIPGEPTDASDEWQPSIAFGSTGEVGLLFNRTITPYTQTDPTQTEVRTRFAWWPNVTSMLQSITAGTNPPVLVDLPAPGTQDAARSIAWGGSQVFAGHNDYQMLTASGCGRFWAAWSYSPFVSQTPGVWSVNVTRIDLSCH